MGLVALLTACQDHSNLYDEDYTNARKQLEYSQSFPVQNIDPNQDWNLFTTANVQVTVNEDWGETYTVKVYTANPLDEESGALLLTKGEVKNGEYFTTTVSVPKATEGVYVSRLSAKGDKLVKYVALENGAISTYFGAEPTTRATRATSSFVEPNLQDSPYTQAEVDELVKQAIEVEASMTYNDLNGSVYKYSKDATINVNLHNAITLIITNGANVTIADEVPYLGGGTIIIDNGTLTLKSTTQNLQNATHLVIMPNGVLDGEYSSPSSIPTYTYNAGLIKGSNIKCMGLYNVGTIDVEDLQYSGWSGGGELTNNGKFTVSGTLDGNNGVLYVNCYTYVNNFVNGCNINLSDYSQLTCNTLSTQNSNTITIGNGAILEANEVSLNYTTFKAPTNTTESDYSDYGYIKFGKVGYFNEQDWQFSGNYVVDLGDYSGANTGSEHQNVSSNVETCLLKSAGAIVAEFNVSTPGANECKGSAENETTTPEEDDDKDVANYVYYAFEDLGSIGDYDFNDVILRVSEPDASGNAKVELVAAGGTLTVAVVYGNTTLWSDVHGEEGFNNSAFVNVGTDKYVTDYPSKTINIGSNPIYNLTDLKLIVNNVSGTNQQLASTTVSAKAATGQAPQCLCVPAGWKWPKEKSSICTVYNTEDFSITNWIQNADSATDWYLNVAPGYESFVVTPEK
jgi:hypothetical protein